MAIMATTLSFERALEELEAAHAALEQTIAAQDFAILYGADADQFDELRCMQEERVRQATAKARAAIARR